jgi:hypothetical protein
LRFFVHVDDVAAEWAATDSLVNVATTGTPGSIIELVVWTPLVVAGVGVELSVGVGEGEPPPVSVGVGLGLEDWVCPTDVEGSGLADAVGGHVAFGVGPVELRGPRLEWPRVLLRPLPPAPPPALPAPPLDGALFDALGEIPCWVLIAM